jgi:hypothetical protein
MGDFDWEVRRGDDGRRAVNLEVSDEAHAPLGALFWAIPETSYPRLVAAAIEGVGATFDDVGVTFPGDLDEGDDSVPRGQVEIFDPLAEVLVPERTFLQILLRVCAETLDALRQRDGIAADTAEALEGQISALRSHLDASRG